MSIALLPYGLERPFPDLYRISKLQVFRPESLIHLLKFPRPAKNSSVSNSWLWRGWFIYRIMFIYTMDRSWIYKYLYGECPSSIFMGYMLHCFSRSMKLILHKCMDHMFDWGPFLQNHQLSPQSNSGSASIRSWEWSGPSPQTDSAWKENYIGELFFPSIRS